MVSRERLLRHAERAAELATTKRVRVVAQLLLVAALVFALVRLRSTWHASHVDLGGVGWAWLSGSLVLGVLAVIAASFIWLSILRSLGTTTRSSWSAVFLQAQLGKYIPGSVWQYAGRGALASARGIPLRAVGKSVPIELGASTCAAAMFSIFLIGWPGAVGLVAVLGALLLAAVRLPRGRVALRAGARASLLYAATWPLIGVSFWATSRAITHIPFGELPVYTGAFAAAWIVGFVAIYAPGGLGVREAMLVAVLGPRIGTPNALVVAAASRIVFTLADVSAAGLSLLAFRRFSTDTASAAPQP